MVVPLTDSAFFTQIIIFVIGLSCCALFSFLETSITALRLFKLKELAARSGKYQALFKSLEQNPNQLLNSIIIANNLADVTAATTGTLVFDRLFSSLPNSIGFTISICITTAALLIVGEIIPKNIAKTQGEKLFTSTLWIANIFFYALYPFVTLLIKFADYVTYKLSGGKEADSGEYITSEKEVQFLINYIREKGLMESEKTAMLQSIFKLGTTPIKEIMVPSTLMVSINAETSIEEAFQLFKQYQFSRFPVYDGTFDNIIGMLHFKDLIPLIENKEHSTLRDILRPILFIPERVKVNQLLKEFKEQHMHIAIVINEFGAIVGLATLEDVLEEIVGEIRDEYEAVTEKVAPLKSGSWLADASVELDQLEQVLNINFDREDAVTLAGFLTEKMHHLPKTGEHVEYEGYIFQVTQASAKKVIQVLIMDADTVDL